MIRNFTAAASALALALPVQGKESGNPESEKSIHTVPPEVSVKVGDVPNPVADPVTTANRISRFGAGGAAVLTGAVSVHYRDAGLSWCWDPIECRLMAVWKGDAPLSTDSDLIFVAEGPQPAVTTIGAWGRPRFFGYRMTGEGLPEFLYTMGRLGIEETVSASPDGKSLLRRFRIVNASEGAMLSVPERWKEAAVASAGEWSGDFLKFNASAAEKGVTLTFALSPPPELPELPETWTKNSAPMPGKLPEKAAPEKQKDPVAATGFTITRISWPAPISGEPELPVDLAFDVRSNLVLSLSSGRILIGTPTAESGDLDWQEFTDHLTGEIVQTDSLPKSLLIRTAGGIVRIFDTSGDGQGDFFKQIVTVPDERWPNLSLTGPAVYGPADEFLFGVSEINSQIVGPPEEDSPPPIAGRFLHLPENPDEAPALLEASTVVASQEVVGIEKSAGVNGFHAVFTGFPGSGAPPQESIWIPAELISGSGDLTFAQSDDSEAMLVVERDAADPLRFLRLIPDHRSGIYQGAVTDLKAGSDESARVSAEFTAARGLWISEDGKAAYRFAGSPGSLLRVAKAATQPAFQVETVSLSPENYLEIGFSLPVDRTSVAVPGNLEVVEQGKGKTSPTPAGEDSTFTKPSASVVDSDGLTVAVWIAEPRPGSIYRIGLSGIKSESGLDLSHGPVWYSINFLPDPEPVTAFEPLGQEPDSEGETSGEAQKTAPTVEE